jgi:hypothetical protein
MMEESPVDRINKWCDENFPRHSKRRGGYVVTSEAVKKALRIPEHLIATGVKWQPDMDAYVFYFADNSLIISDEQRIAMEGEQVVINTWDLEE